jgi:hypothetical protein
MTERSEVTKQLSGADPQADGLRRRRTLRSEVRR